MLTSSILLFPSLLVWAGVHDLFTRIIPNRLAIALAAGFALAAYRTGMAPSALLSHLECGAAMLLAGLALFALKIIGGGDAKLFAAASLWLGWDLTGEFALATVLFGGGLAVLYLAAETWRESGSGQKERMAATLPYGAAIAAGGLWVFPDWAAGLPLPA
jgi:prepilin peptidase CpaA